MNQPTKTTPQEARRNRFALVIVLILIMAVAMSWFGDYLGLSTSQFTWFFIATLVYSALYERLLKWASKV